MITNTEVTESELTNKTFSKLGVLTTRTLGGSIRQSGIMHFRSSWAFYFGFDLVDEYNEEPGVQETIGLAKQNHCLKKSPALGDSSCFCDNSKDLRRIFRKEGIVIKTTKPSQIMEFVRGESAVIS